MIIYEGTKSDFHNDVLGCTIDNRIKEQFKAKLQREVSPSEVRSWRNSMQFVDRALDDNEIPQNAGIAIEFKVPYTSKRIDFIISGKDESGTNSAVVIELKQWESIDIVRYKDGVVRTYLGGGTIETTHPSYQAWSYAVQIKDYNESVQEKNVIIKPCAFLHNYKRCNPDKITDPIYGEYISEAPVFAKDEYDDLRSFIKRYIKHGDNKETLYIIDNGKIRPSKSLQDALANMLRGKREFVLLDDQKLAYEMAVQLATKSYQDGKKRVLIVTGGPGTGKTVLAMNLLVQLTNKNMVCQYVSKNAAPRYVFMEKLAGHMQKARISNLFKGSGSYTSAPNNEIDVLLVDESHRLNEKSGLFRNQGENQIKEIIHTAKFVVFFIDESQRIDIFDIGSVAEIKKWIAEEGVFEYAEMDLPSQFRCNGSDGFLAWLDDLLEIRETSNIETPSDYDIRVYDDPCEMYAEIKKLNAVNNKARMLAGYCWDWIPDGKNNPNSYDIQIPSKNFAMSWNLGNTSTWAIDPNSVNQVGCIHTSQGLEFEYVGVIIGKDLRYENGHIVTDFSERASTDKSLKGIKTLYKKNREKALAIADEIIKNTYRTLMTRGMKGCFIYCENKELGEYIKDRLGI
ncbi:MAG: DUF2075 domain-containing protein [Candidatus Merdousia sp.]|nr:DUF2075 domain-containing protein [Candidatus Merdousia sp.]